jgi:hypothetical protein
MNEPDRGLELGRHNNRVYERHTYKKTLVGFSQRWAEQILINELVIPLEDVLQL